MKYGARWRFASHSKSVFNNYTAEKHGQGLKRRKYDPQKKKKNRSLCFPGVIKTQKESGLKYVKRFSYAVYRFALTLCVAKIKRNGGFNVNFISRRNFEGGFRTKGTFVVSSLFDVFNSTIIIFPSFFFPLAEFQGLNKKNRAFLFNYVPGSCNFATTILSTVEVCRETFMRCILHCSPLRPKVKIERRVVNETR